VFIGALIPYDGGEKLVRVSLPDILRLLRIPDISR